MKVREVGSKVTIKDRDSLRAIGVPDMMQSYAGKTCVIEKVVLFDFANEYTYTIKRQGTEWYWTEEMFEQEESLEVKKARLEKELAEVQKEIKKQTNPKYDSNRIYVTNRSVSGYGPYILVGGIDNYSFKSLAGTISGWISNLSSGQVAIDSVIQDGFEVKEFTSRKEALSYFLSQLGDK